MEDVAKVLRHAIRKEDRLANNYAVIRCRRLRYESSLKGGAAAAKPSASKPKAPVKQKQVELESMDDFDDD